MTHRRRNGFTILEVLVVIATIGLLVGIVVPSLTAARDAAKRAVCGSNLRQVGVAIHCYADHYDGSIPYGPKAQPSFTAANFYPATGTPTSLISLLSGKPVGAGLLLDGHLSSAADSLFCPGADQAVDAKAELNGVGKTQAQSSYYYRHASIARQFDPPGQLPVPEHVKLHRLGHNRNDKPIRALAIDTQFDVSPTFASFGIGARTHHRGKGVNVLLYDGSVHWSPNTDDRFTVRLQTAESLHSAFSVILSTLEAAD